MSVKKASSSRKTGNRKSKIIKNKKTEEPKGLHIEVVSIALLMLAVFSWVSIYKFRGLPQDDQLIGFLGTYYLKGVDAVFSQGAFLIPVFLLFWSIHTGVSKKMWSARMWGMTLLSLVTLLGISVYQIPQGISEWEAGFKGMGGGYLGGALAYIFIKLIGRIGTQIIIVFGTLISMVMIVDMPIQEIIKTVTRYIKRLWEKLGALMFYEYEEEDPPHRNRRSAPLIIDAVQEGANEPDVPGSQSEKVLPFTSIPNKAPILELVPDLRLVADNSPKGAAKGNGAGEYHIPPLDILSDVTSERTIDKKNIEESIAVLEDTFSNFGVKVKVNQVSCGPAVTRYELSPGAGVKISKIISLTDDLQLNLAAPGIRVEAPIPGKAAVGIEVPNRKIMSVGLRRLLSSAIFSRLNTPLAFALGEDISGNTVAARLNDMPHLLIAGSTGSGKSVCLNCIIMSLIYNSFPDELKLVFIDPKMVELTVYNGIPHLMTPVVTDPKKASVVLKWMASEMEKRYQKFADMGVRDIQRYNQESQEKMPYIVIVIDELADLMMVAPVEVEDSICRLAQMARAAGMHLIVATQRPSVDVVTGTIKANIPSRIAFAVSSNADSRTILDTSGAEKLLGKGDMLFLPVGASKPFRVQGAYVSDQDIEKTVDYIKEQAMNSSGTEIIEELELSLEQVEDDSGDDLFWDAVTVFVDSRKASVSLLQRRLRIGYARAARLVDLMEDRGIVSELDSNKRREILINKEQLEMLQSRHGLA
ncbi:cell division protein ftsk [hydrocarbon metagenome]|uniref:Cell division protein ftsk n=1 Tax=hydrocarbon metagenome TaxID=938273 RepID=A0A0W8E5E2_9ZZZZ